MSAQRVESSHVESSRVIKATPFFYGWVILVAGTLGSVMMGPSQTFTFVPRPQKRLAS